MNYSVRGVKPNSQVLIEHASRFATIIVAVVLLWSALPTTNVDAHADLDALRSNPTPDSVNEVPPEKIRLWFTEPLDPDQSQIQVFDESGQQVDAEDSSVDEGDPHQMVVSLESIPDGTYSVSWSVVSTADGHPSQGTFSFQVGQARLPGGAATTGGERPSLDAVALRWLAIGGLALVAGWFVLHPLSVDISRTNRALALGAVVASLLASFYQILQQGELSDLIQIASDMPLYWYFRLVLEIVLLGIVILIVRRGAGRTTRLLGLALSGLAVITLTYTTHAAADENPVLTMPVNALHLVSVAFWLGGLAHLALASVTGDEIDRAVIGRFSRFAAVAAPVALLTGFINAGMLLPSVESAWESAYGQTLILKLVLVVGALALAWFNRYRLTRYLTELGTLFRSLRTEAVFGIGVVLVASFMALSALPGPEEDHPLHLQVSADDGQFANLRMDNPDTGERDVMVWLSDDQDEPIADVDEVDVELSMLEQNDDIEASAERQQDGRWLVHDWKVETEGWWRATVDFTRGSETVSSEFLFMLPDPTLIDTDFDRSTDQDAVEVYQTALSQLLDLESMRAVENLGDGAGNLVRTEYQYLAPDRLRYVTSSGNESIAIGGEQYLLKSNADSWMVRDRVRTYSFPDVFSFFYSGARDVTFGREVTRDGTTYRLVSFYVPRVTGRAESWYLWFIDTATGMLKREAMIANHHYMDNEFGSFNEPMEIERPEIEDTEASDAPGETGSQ